MPLESNSNPTPPAEADLRAALSGIALADGAERHVTRILAEDLKGVSPALLKEAVAARLASDEFACFRKPTSPPPGSLEAIGAQLEAHRSQVGGLPAHTAPDGKYNLAGAPDTRPQHGAPSGRLAANAEMEELSKFAGRPGVHWNDLSSAEQLMALANRHAASRASLSGLQIIAPK